MEIVEVSTSGAVEPPVGSVDLEELVDGAHACALRHHGAQPIVVGGGLPEQLPANGQPEATDTVRLDVWALLQEADRGVHVAFATPSPPVRFTVAVAGATAVEQQHSVAVGDQHPGVLSVHPPRPGNTTTAAPLRDGTYQPVRRSPSLVRSETSSWAAPSRGAGTDASAVLVTAYDSMIGNANSAMTSTATTVFSERRTYRRQRRPSRRRLRQRSRTPTPTMAAPPTAANNPVQSSPATESVVMWNSASELTIRPTRPSSSVVTARASTLEAQSQPQQDCHRHEWHQAAGQMIGDATPLRLDIVVVDDVHHDVAAGDNGGGGGPTLGNVGVVRSLVAANVWSAIARIRGTRVLTWRPSLSCRGAIRYVHDAKEPGRLGRPATG